MVTKTELLNKLTSEQLREIAVTENIKISKKTEKNEIINKLLKLHMRRIKAYVAEYSETQTRKKRKTRHSHRQHDKLPEELTENIGTITKGMGKIGEEVGQLIKEKLKTAKLEDLSTIIDKKLTKAMQTIETHETKPTKETTKPKEKTTPKKTEPLPDRITTGIQDLDNLLLGGIPKNYSVILTSKSSDERELLIKRYLEAGAKEGQITFYVTIEASDVKNLAEEFQSNFYLFICNPQANSIIKTLPNVFKLKGIENLTEINIALTSAFRKLDASLKGPRRACIEIISDILLQHHAASIRKWLAALIPELKSRGFTTLAVMNPHMHNSQEVQAVLDLFEGEINIYEKQTRKGPEKHLKITKLHNQRYMEDELPLKKEKM